MNSDQVFGQVVRVQPSLTPQVHVDDVAVGVAGERDAVRAVGAGVVQFGQILEQLDHLRVDVVEDLVVGEVLEDSRGGEFAEVTAAVHGEDIRHLVLDEARAQIGGGIGGVDDVDGDVGVFRLESLDQLLELADCLYLVLEEFESDVSGGGCATTGECGHACGAGTDGGDGAGYAAGLCRHTVRASIMPGGRPALGPRRCGLHLLLLLSFTLHDFATPRLS